MAFQNMYFARFLSKSFMMKHTEFVDLACQGKVLSLESFWESASVERVLLACPEVKIFLDSGAYTMEKKEVTDIQGYMDSYVDFVLKYKSNLMVYANVDDTRSPEETWRRQQYLENHGISPVPVFHAKEDFKWFEKYVNEYDYIAIGGLASGDVTTHDFKVLSDRIFTYIYKNDLQSVKLHGFAVFSLPFLLRYPWYSSDATTWLLPAAYGNVFIPRYDEKRSEYNFLKIPYVIKVSELGLYQDATIGVHYTLEYLGNERMRNIIEQYFDMIGVDTELLKTSYHEREKVMVHFYKTFAKKLRLHTATFKPQESFFI